MWFWPSRSALCREMPESRCVLLCEFLRPLPNQHHQIEHHQTPSCHACSRLERKCQRLRRDRVSELRQSMRIRSARVRSTRQSLGWNSLEPPVHEESRNSLPPNVCLHPPPTSVARREPNGAA